MRLFFNKKVVVNVFVIVLIISNCFAQASATGSVYDWNQIYEVSNSTFLEKSMRIADEALRNRFPNSTNAVINNFVTVNNSTMWILNTTDDPEFLHGMYRFGYLPHMVLSSVRSDNPAYLIAAGNLLKSFYQQALLKCEPYWKCLEFKRLNVGLRLFNFFICWDILQSKGIDPYTTPLGKQSILAGVENDIEVLCKSARGQLKAKKFSNHDFFVARALLLASSKSVVGDKECSAKWGSELLRASLDSLFYPDGMIVDQSPMYHSAIVRILMEILGILGPDQMILEVPEVNKIRKAYNVAVQFRHSNGDVPAISDSDRGELLPENLTGATGSEGGWPFLGPDCGMGGLAPFFVLEDAGYVLIHDKLGDKGRSFIYDYGPHGGWHGHYDLFSFEYFDEGQVVLSDPGRWMYDKSNDRKWVKSTAAHNTISINGKNISETRTVECDVKEVNNGIHITSNHNGFAFIDKSIHVSREIDYEYGGVIHFNDLITSDILVDVNISFLVPCENVAVNGNTVSFFMKKTSACYQIVFRDLKDWGISLKKAWVSPTYGVKLDATQIVLKHSGAGGELNYDILRCVRY